MNAVISFSLFQYKCIEINQGEELFTYKTDEKTAKKVTQELFDIFKILTDSEKIIKELFSERHSHKVNLEKRNLILKIFKNFGFKEPYIDQYIGDSVIYQKQTKGKTRLFFIIETKKITEKELLRIIKPLFLDVNHVIYNDPSYQKNFHTCAVCWQQKCTAVII